MIRQLLASALVLALIAAGAWTLWRLPPTSVAADHADHADHGDHADPGDPAMTGADDHADEGPHGGRLLRAGDLSLELVIFERGVPPEYHVYASRDGRPLLPQAVALEIELHRLGGAVDRFSFAPMEDFLRSRETVTEPHSFDVVVTASVDGETHEWRYASHEGRVRIPAALAEEAGIAVAPAGPATLRETLTLPGRVRPDPDRMARVSARFPGLIQAVKAAPGERVRQGQVLARVESDESLRSYDIQAPINGWVVARQAQVGATTGSEPLFEILDTDQVWVELDAFGRDLARLAVGQAVTVRDAGGGEWSGRIDYISPQAAGASQSARARVVLDNSAGRLRPGQFVEGVVTLAEQRVPLAVPPAAIQRFRDFRVVFARYGETYEVRMLELGRETADWVEVRGGLEPGTPIVVANSYLIKADIEKSGASHDH